MQKWRGGRGREKRKTAEHFSTTLRSNFVTSKNLFFPFLSPFPPRATCFPPFRFLQTRE
jgi:hypothetical protein